MSFPQNGPVLGAITGTGGNPYGQPAYAGAQVPSAQASPAQPNPNNRWTGAAPGSPSQGGQQWVGPTAPASPNQGGVQQWNPQMAQTSQSGQAPSPWSQTASAQSGGTNGANPGWGQLASPGVTQGYPPSGQGVQTPASQHHGPPGHGSQGHGAAFPGQSSQSQGAQHPAPAGHNQGPHPQTVSAQTSAPWAQVTPAGPPPITAAPYANVVMPAPSYNPGQPTYGQGHPGAPSGGHPNPLAAPYGVPPGTYNGPPNQGYANHTRTHGDNNRGYNDNRDNSYALKTTPLASDAGQILAGEPGDQLFVIGWSPYSLGLIGPGLNDPNLPAVFRVMKDSKNLPKPGQPDQKISGLWFSRKDRNQIVEEVERYNHPERAQQPQVAMDPTMVLGAITQAAQANQQVAVHGFTANPPGRTPTPFAILPNGPTASFPDSFMAADGTYYRIHVHILPLPVLNQSVKIDYGADGGVQPYKVKSVTAAGNAATLTRVTPSGATSQDPDLHVAVVAGQWQAPGLDLYHRLIFEGPRVAESNTAPSENVSAPVPSPLFVPTPVAISQPTAPSNWGPTAAQMSAFNSSPGQANTLSNTVGPHGETRVYAPEHQSPAGQGGTAPHNAQQTAPPPGTLQGQAHHNQAPNRDQTGQDLYPQSQPNPPSALLSSGAHTATNSPGGHAPTNFATPTPGGITAAQIAHGFPPGQNNSTQIGQTSADGTNTAQTQSLVNPPPRHDFLPPEHSGGNRAHGQTQSNPGSTTSSSTHGPTHSSTAVPTQVGYQADPNFAPAPTVGVNYGASNVGPSPAPAQP